MSSGANYFLKKTMGDDFFESLVKFELWKPGTRTVIDHEEIKTALMIVPRVLMAMLIRELTAMEIGQTKEIHLPVSTVPALVRVTKHERDVYSGEIEQENKMVVDFKYRSIPGVGLVIMSAFELYDTSKLLEDKNERTGDKNEDNTQKLQDMIDKRLALHDMIARVVDKKLEEREAINKLFLNRLEDELKKEKKVAQQIDDVTKIAKDPGNAHADEYMRGMANGLEVANSIANDKEPQFVEPIKKGSPLKTFLEKKGSKAKAEFSIEMVKGETVRCPDCGNALISGEVFTGCVCLGDDMGRKVYIKKTEDGIKVRFGRGWDKDNIEMLLEVLRSKRGQ